MVEPQISPASLSHYHPFDPSTKWPSQGILSIWLIIPPCGLPATLALGIGAA
jgi:hypothetical protein